jgi:hypothetical protein
VKDVAGQEYAQNLEGVQEIVKNLPAAISGSAQVLSGAYFILSARGAFARLSAAISVRTLRSSNLAVACLPTRISVR